MGIRQATTERRTGTRLPAYLSGREVVIPPGGCTGWHYHLVPLMAAVTSGTLTRILSDGTVEVHPTGATFVEPEGHDHVHLGRNLGPAPVVLHVTCALADDDPWALPAPAPLGATPCGCADHTP
ncbi:cupin domain-containing protein [Streptomyces sp. NPDC006670]|uniref:cupin domain-containing protein n=1 Tax=Streptomyces sp. NPDC006670 TaxID=3154476 RepID=UPI0034063AD3